MTFEEFFKKKKISLPLLQDAEPGLFTEFERHFAQMGEKSFDHTKKYWFNKLRRSFPLPPEVKAEKLVIENPLAEQTIIEALTEPAAPAPSVGFKPRFKAANSPKPTEEKAEEETANAEGKPADKTTSPTVGFKPRFKSSMVAKPVEKAEEKPVEASAATEIPPAEEAPKPTVGFKPRFKASMVTKPAAEQTTPVEDKAVEMPEEKPEETSPDTPADSSPKPVGFKPRFNAAKMKPKEPGAE